MRTKLNLLKVKLRRRAKLKQTLIEPILSRMNIFKTIIQTSEVKIGVAWPGCCDWDTESPDVTDKWASLFLDPKKLVSKLFILSTRLVCLLWNTNRASLRSQQNTVVLQFCLKFFMAINFFFPRENVCCSCLLMPDQCIFFYTRSQLDEIRPICASHQGVLQVVTYSSFKNYSSLVCLCNKSISNVFLTRKYKLELIYIYSLTRLSIRPFS